MQNLDGTSETIATTLCLWIAGLWYPIPLFKVFAYGAKNLFRRFPLIQLQMHQFAAE
jgi:hypothetical protein